MKGARGVEGERACEKLEFILSLMASDSLQVSPHSPPPSLAPEEEGPTSRVGFMIIEEKKKEKESEGKHVFSPGTPAAARQ